MKTLTISLSLILSLGLFGCGDEESASTPTSQEPNMECVGDVTSQAQLDSVRDCTVIWGSIRFNDSDVTVINLPLLEEITGRVFLQDNSRLTKILLPALTYMYAGLEIDHHESLTELSLPVLNTIGSTLYINEVNALREISLPVLTSVDYIAITYNGALTDVSMPNLTSVEDFGPDSIYPDSIHISSNSKLQNCDLGSYTDQYCP